MADSPERRLPFDPAASQRRSLLITFGVVELLTVMLWIVAGRESLHAFGLNVAVSLASFVVGSLLGFLISSYGEENATLGKVRDWLIGGTSALTLANIGPIKDFLLAVGKANGEQRIDIVITLCMVVLNVGVGFFFMYYSRELSLNVSLAKSRAERMKLEGSVQAGQVIQQFLVRLPASMLTGVHFCDEIDNLSKDDVDQLKTDLYAPEVDQFLQQAEDAVPKGLLDWDTIAKAAYIYYYRTYFDKENAHKAVDKAIEWLLRAITINPNHVELTMKYAEMLSTRDEDDAAVTILERLATRAEAPILVLEWLGYYLRFIPSRLDDSIEYSKRYIANKPNDTDPLFNLAYAYGRKYCSELRKAGAAELLTSANRLEFLDDLKKALLDQPKMKKTVKDKWFEAGTGLECLKSDKELVALLQSIPDPAPATPVSAPQP